GRENEHTRALRRNAAAHRERHAARGEPGGDETWPTHRAKDRERKEPIGFAERLATERARSAWRRERDRAVDERSRGARDPERHRDQKPEEEPHHELARERGNELGGRRGGSRPSQRTERERDHQA